MKIVSREEITRTIKRECAEAREWCRQGHGRYHQMMLNTDDASIWSDNFMSENDWKVYRSASIHALEYIPGYARETEAGYINDAVRLLKAAGWDITE